MQVPKRKSETARIMQRRQDYHLTPEAIEGLKREFVDLKERQRPRVAEEAQRMREMGDLSENAGYQSAKAQLVRINFRLLEIEDQLKYAVLIKRGVSVSGRVQIGSTITIARDGVERAYEILGSEEVDLKRGRISHNSPLGAALIGHKIGDDVTLTISGRVTHYRIVRVT